MQSPGCVDPARIDIPHGDLSESQSAAHGHRRATGILGPVAELAEVVRAPAERRSIGAQAAAVSAAGAYADPVKEERRGPRAGRSGHARRRTDVWREDDTGGRSGNATARSGQPRYRSRLLPAQLTCCEQS